VEKDRNAALHMLNRIIDTLEGLRPECRHALHVSAMRLVEGCRRHFDHNRDLELLDELQSKLAYVQSSDRQLKVVGKLENKDSNETSSEN
jgi:hypothetical protein